MFRRRDESGVDSRREQERAARLDDALTEWQRGRAPAEPVSIDDEADLAGEPFGDELAAAHRLARYADAGRPAPHEPLVALRAALAARRSSERPAWRGVFVLNRLAPTLAFVALVVGTLVGLDLTRPDANPPGGAPLAERPVSSVREMAQRVKAQVDRLQDLMKKPGVEPQEVAKQYESAYILVQRATGALEAAVPSTDDPGTKALAQQVKEAQAAIEVLRAELADVLARAAATTTTNGAATAAAGSSTTTQPDSSTTSSSTPSSTVTTQPRATTTTGVAPTTTAPPTTEAPSRSTTTTAPTTTSTTTPPPGDVGPASGTESVGF